MRVPIRKPGKFTFQKPDLHITQVKFAELQKKLQSLKASHPQLTAEVRRLAELGDLSENAAYQIAKGKLRGVNQKILELQDYLAHAEIIEANPDNNKIQIGHTVTVELNGKKLDFLILGSSETDPGKGIISHRSPIGSGLLNKRVGQIATIQLKDKTVEYKIIAIK